MNLAHDLERRNGVGAILTEFRAAEDLEPDMLRQCFAADALGQKLDKEQRVRPSSRPPADGRLRAVLGFARPRTSATIGQRCSGGVANRSPNAFWDSRVA